MVLGHTRAKVVKIIEGRGLVNGQLDPWPGWSATVSDIPLTFDEQLSRDRTKKDGQTELERLQAMAMTAQLGIPLPSALATSLGGIRELEALKAEPQTLCPDGHANRAGSRFCDGCGVSMQVPVAAEAGAV